MTLLQLTTNLLHNAIVHNLPDQAAVWVTTSAHPDTVVLTVENTGETLTPQVVATLAEPFQRGSQRVRTGHAGVGLGLAIVKSMVQAHDRTLTLSPRAGGGLCVAVQLPAAPPHLQMTVRETSARFERNGQGQAISAPSACGPHKTSVAADIDRQARRQAGHLRP